MTKRLDTTSDEDDAVAQRVFDTLGESRVREIGEEVLRELLGLFLKSLVEVTAERFRLFLDQQDEQLKKRASNVL